MSDRSVLHALVDELPPPELLPARRFLEYLREHGGDPLKSGLDAAPIDDEPVTSEDLTAIRAGLDDKADGAAISHEEVKRLLREAG